MKLFKKLYPATTAIIMLLINVFVVWIGRIFFPVNFHPKTISFFENYWVLTAGECFVMLLIFLCVMSIRLIYLETKKELKSIFYKN